MLPTPACGPVRRRDVFLTGPGPDSGSSRPFRDAWLDEPEKSGIDAPLGVPVSVGVTAGAAVCPDAGVAAAVAKVTNKSKSRGRTFMLPSLSWFHRHSESLARAERGWIKASSVPTPATPGPISTGSLMHQCRQGLTQQSRP